MTTLRERRRRRIRHTMLAILDVVTLGLTLGAGRNPNVAAAAQAAQAIDQAARRADDDTVRDAGRVR